MAESPAGGDANVVAGAANVYGGREMTDCLCCKITNCERYIAFFIFFIAGVSLTIWSFIEIAGAGEHVK